MLEKIIFVILIGIIFSLFLQPISADTPIKITISSTMEQIIFDGKWTHSTEWKKSSLDSLDYKEPIESIKLRTAHQGNFVYVMINFVSDTTPNEDDFAIICFDTNNDKSEIPQLDDFCFKSTLGESEGIVLQGNPENTNSFFLQTNSPEGFIAISSESDSEDRYSNIPHSTYEFRIPTDFISRQSIYGFYMSAYDSDIDQTFSWPMNVELGKADIPNPSMWGEMISPDKSLPEFEWPLLTLIPIMGLVIYLTKKVNSKFLKDV